MKISLNSSTDLLALNSTLPTSGEELSIAWIIANFATLQVPKDQDLEIHISNDLIPMSARSNPSSYSLQIRAKCADLFGSSSGHVQDGKIVLLLMRSTKKITSHQVRNSITAEIKKWLQSTTQELVLPIASIPECYQRRPEQLTFKIKRETSQAIKLNRLKTLWKITRKS